MRWRIHHHGHHHHRHDPRQVDLIAVFALLIVIVAACSFFTGHADAPSATAFIVPSQSVRW
jgi:hypothetical protein